MISYSPALTLVHLNFSAWNLTYSDQKIDYESSRNKKFEINF